MRRHTVCYRCVAPKRFPGCHGTCPEYKLEAEEIEQEKAAIKAKRELESVLYRRWRNQV